MKLLLMLSLISSCFAVEVVVSKREFISVVGTDADTKRIESVIRVVISKAVEESQKNSYIQKVEVLRETCNLVGKPYATPGCTVKYHIDMN